MRHALANLVLASATLAGCSLIYNPNDLPRQADAMPDMQQIVDANPSALALTGVAPTTLLEGTGDGGGRFAILVIAGTDIAQSGVTVEIVAAQGATKTPMLAFDPGNVQIDVYGHHIAVPVHVPVDTNLAAGESIALDVRVTQDGGGTPVSATLSGMLTLQGFDEYDTATALDNGMNQFSRVMLTEGTVPVPAPATGPLYIHSNSSISIDDDVVLAVDGATPGAGPNGGAGGTGGPSNLFGAPGNPGMGPAFGAAGQPAGPWVGDDQLTTLDANQNRGSGGGGGASGQVISVRGGDGGGGGGSISLSAPGNIDVGAISAKGGAGETGGGVANPGSPGSGGAILLRAGGTLDTGALDVSGSNPGRVRADAGRTRTGAGDAYQGPAFPDLPLIINTETPEIEIVGGSSIVFQYIVIHGTDIAGPTSLTMGSNGRTTITPQLRQGLNQICVLVDDAAPSSPTRNCVSVAHIFKP